MNYKVELDSTMEIHDDDGIRTYTWGIVQLWAFK